MFAYEINYSKVTTYICIIHYSLLGYFYVISLKKKKNNEIELNTLIACSSVKFPDRQKSRNENKVNAVPSSESNTIFGTRRDSFIE